MSNSPANPTVHRPTARWIGPTGGDDIGPCWRRLNRDVHFVEAATDQRGIDLTVLACPRPLVDTDKAQLLLEEAGADRFVQLLGVWCEGEGRTGKPVPGAERVFWHAWPAWQRRWLERLSADSISPLPPRLPQLVRIDTPDGELAKALVAALVAEDIGAVWSRKSLAAGADAILWDGAQLSGREADHLAAVCSAGRYGQTPVIALLDFPRPETVAAARALGAADVLGKPLTTELLLESLVATMRLTRRSRVFDSPSRFTASRRRESSVEPWYSLHTDDLRRRLATH